MKFIQKNNFGIATHVGLEYKINNVAGLFAQIKTEYLYVKDSNIVQATYVDSGVFKTSYFVEPANNTLQAGLEVGLTF